MKLIVSMLALTLALSGCGSNKGDTASQWWILAVMR